MHRADAHRYCIPWHLIVAACSEKNMTPATAPHLPSGHRRITPSRSEAKGSVVPFARRNRAFDFGRVRG